jgi:hypothetical protein
MPAREDLPPRKLLLAAGILCAVAALLTLAFILVNGVNAPFADEWWYASLVRSVSSGHATFDSFWSPNNEHRMLIPRIEFSTLAVLTRWNSKAMMIAGWLAAAAAALVIFSQFKQIYPRRHPRLWVAATAVSAATLFSLVQTENWLWAFQFTFFFINFAVVAALFVVCRSPTPLRSRLVVAGALAVAASFSSAQGLLVWPALALSLGLTNDSVRSKIAGLLLLFLAAATTLAIYYSGMQRATELHLTKEQILQKVQLPLFGFLGLLGNPLTHWISYEHLPHRAWFIGLAIGVLFLFLVFIVAKERRLPDAAPWVGMGGYACLVCLVITYGRLGMGYTGGFLTSRYTTHAALLPIAILALLLIALDSTDAEAAPDKSWITRLRIPGAVLTITAIGMLILTGDVLTFRSGAIERNARLVAKTLVPFSAYFDPGVDGVMTGPLYPLCPLACVTIFGTGVKELTDAGYFSRADDIQFVANGSEASGNYKVSRKIVEQRYLGIVEPGWDLSGTVTIDSKLAPNLIFLRPAGRDAFVAATELHPTNQHNNSGHTYEWRLFLSPFILPDRNTQMEMWVYDAESNAFVKVSQEQWNNNDNPNAAGG